MSAPWWRGAPVSKAIFYGTLVTSLYAVSLSQSQTRASFTQNSPFALHAGSVLARHEFWRLLTSHVPFGHLIDMFFGLSYLYQTRVLERLLGSEKFGAFLFIVLSLTTSLELAWLTQTSSSFQFSVGPYAIVGACMVLQQGDIRLNL